jgi:integrase
MADVNYYLKKQESNGKSLIFLRFFVQGRPLTYSFAQSIKPKFWDKKKQRVKNNRITTEDGNHSLNDLLDTLEKVLLKAYKDELKNGIPERGKLKKHLDGFINQNKDDDGGKEEIFFKLIDRFICGEIKNRGKDKSQNTLDNYYSVKQHLLAFQETPAYKKRYTSKITFDKITLDFFYSYVAFLKTLKNQKGEPISQNTIAKDIRLLKVFMGEAVDLKLTSNLEFKHDKFNIAEVATDAVYLSEKEIEKLYKHDLSDKGKLEAVRDLFVFGCCVGLRFSDYSKIRKENIVKIEEDLFVKLITEKTEELVIIPCSPLVLQIFKRYEGNENRLPKSISNQKFNDYIKEACQLAELNETGRLSTDLSKPLYQCVTSHTARRSFATNLYLDGYPVIEIMKITGHKTEKAFMKYIRVTKLDAAKRLAAHLKKRWSEKMLRVA